jgi:hypothetical protein
MLLVPASVLQYVFYTTYNGTFIELMLYSCMFQCVRSDLTHAKLDSAVHPVTQGQSHL